MPTTISPRALNRATLERQLLLRRAPADRAAAGRELYAGRALTQAELRRHLGERWPGRDPEALAYSVNYLTPLVQAPPGGLWGRHGSIPYTLADTCLDRPVASEAA